MSTGHVITPEIRKKISESMKKAIKDGRAHGWANVKQNKNGMSYPELWFESVIKNEQLDLNYEYNLQFFKYKLDFAWPEKRLCIEIDGNQHNFEDRKISDLEKDKLLNEHGWKVLRLKWGYIQKNKIECINLIKNFLNNNIGNIEIPLYKTKEELLVEKQKENEINGTLKDSLGRFNHNKLSKEQLLERKNKILNSGIDLTKYGWVTKVSKITNLTTREINFTVNYFNDLKNKVFYRK